MRNIVILNHNFSHFSKLIDIIIDQALRAGKPAIPKYWTLSEDQQRYEQDLLNGNTQKFSGLVCEGRRHLATR